MIQECLSFTITWSVHTKILLCSHFDSQDQEAEMIASLVLFSLRLRFDPLQSPIQLYLSLPLYMHVHIYTSKVIRDLHWKLNTIIYL